MPSGCLQRLLVIRGMATPYDAFQHFLVERGMTTCLANGLRSLWGGLEGLCYCPARAAAGAALRPRTPGRGAAPGPQKEALLCQRSCAHAFRLPPAPSCYTRHGNTI